MDAVRVFNIYFCKTPARFSRGWRKPRTSFLVFPLHHDDVNASNILPAGNQLLQCKNSVFVLTSTQFAVVLTYTSRNCTSLICVCSYFLLHCDFLNALSHAVLCSNALDTANGFNVETGRLLANNPSTLSSYVWPIFPFPPLYKRMPDPSSSFPKDHVPVLTFLGNDAQSVHDTRNPSPSTTSLSTHSALSLQPHAVLSQNIQRQLCLRYPVENLHYVIVNERKAVTELCDVFQGALHFLKPLSILYNLNPQKVAVKRFRFQMVTKPGATEVRYSHLSNHYSYH